MNAFKKMALFALVIAFTACNTTTKNNIDSITETINQPGRSDADRARDTYDKPAEILKLLDLHKGDRVADLFAGGGYYSELFAYVVDESGEVLAHTMNVYQQFIGDALEKRFEKRLPQVKIYSSEPNDIEIGSNAYDAIVMVMAYHDLYFSNEKIGWPPIDSAKLLNKVHAALKPGGKLLIIDHSAKDGIGNSEAATLHRIEESFALQDIKSIGFELAATSDALRNPEDDRTLNVFKDAIRHKTDRFVLLFAKP